MCRDPFRREDLREWLAFFDRVERRAHVEFFNVAVDARLHHRNGTFVEGDGTDHLQFFVERAFGDFGGTDAQILYDARTDLDRSAVGAIFAVDGYQHHVHERRFTGLVEFLLRIHRVVIVERFFICRSCAGGRAFRRHAHAR